jgi:hypothetical protein
VPCSFIWCLPYTDERDAGLGRFCAITDNCILDHTPIADTALVPYSLLQLTFNERSTCARGPNGKKEEGRQGGCRYSWCCGAGVSPPKDRNPVSCLFRFPFNCLFKTFTTITIWENTICTAAAVGIGHPIPVVYDCPFVALAFFCSLTTLSKSSLPPETY